MFAELSTAACMNARYRGSKYKVRDFLYFYVSIVNVKVLCIELN